MRQGEDRGGMTRTTDDDRRLFSRYLRDIRAIPPLSRSDEECLLGQIEAGDPHAPGRLAERHLGFVVKIASEYRSLGVPLEDLLNEGNLGLLEAARRFDPSQGTRFITYAVWWVRKAILAAIADRSLVVRLPAYQRKRMYELRQAETALAGKLGRAPTRQEIADHMSVSPAHVDRLRGLHLAHLSLDRLVAEVEVPRSSLLRDSGSSSERRLLDKEAQSLVARAFRKLSPREQAVLGWRFALGDEPPMTLKQIGKRLGLSRERVRQIEVGAMQRLRRLLTGSRHRA